MSKSALSNPHSGEVLLEEFLTPMGISSNTLARTTGVPPRRINEIVLGKRGVTVDTAVRLAAALGASERFWFGLQADFDLEEAHRVLGNTLEQIERIAAWGLCETSRVSAALPADPAAGFASVAWSAWSGSGRAAGYRAASERCFA